MGQKIQSKTMKYYSSPASCLPLFNQIKTTKQKNLFRKFYLFGLFCIKIHGRVESLKDLNWLWEPAKKIFYALVNLIFWYKGGVVVVKEVWRSLRMSRQGGVQ